MLQAHVAPNRLSVVLMLWYEFVWNVELICCKVGKVTNFTFVSVYIFVYVSVFVSVFECVSVFVSVLVHESLFVSIGLGI